MRRILRFLRSPARDQLLLMKTLLLLGSIRLALSLLPFRVLDRLLKQFSRTADRISGTETDRQDADRIAWAGLLRPPIYPGRHLPGAFEFLAVFAILTVLLHVLLVPKIEWFALFAIGVGLLIASGEVRGRRLQDFDTFMRTRLGPRASRGDDCLLPEACCR